MRLMGQLLLMGLGIDAGPALGAAVMTGVVAAAAELAKPGDTVLLAPPARRSTSSPDMPTGATRSPPRCAPRSGSDRGQPVHPAQAPG